MNLTSKKIQVNQPAALIFGKLTGSLENYRQLMPSEVAEFKTDGDTFTFGLKGFPEVHLKIKETVANQKVTFESFNSPIKFQLSCFIQEIGEGISELQFAFDGEVNMMMRMMLEKPLQNFIDKLADKAANL
ncbi:hypothetical protein [Schleiferia thermophila]|jgi:carbon monoxide dehydrogenase subunit G|uniref:Orotate phosphoribosyltransferase n=1 Tax=Schleiferia thermophila TaxID=884107 RepID=A0A369A4R8_9FLAO|nr:hypothetical protein [Schleiferia thermophila]KFD39162.1 orotate phosphoribosyltransferase [Schleiferia thermophila str. Yellowstone]RCX03346.1 hypothetical protein DES35_103231 [Schleiferia thermophila]GCD80475.1 hypothetical protein JCM30197_17220 [Schleiferia thermophila]